MPLPPSGNSGPLFNYSQQQQRHQQPRVSKKRKNMGSDRRIPLGERSNHHSTTTTQQQQQQQQQAMGWKPHRKSKKKGSSKRHHNNKHKKQQNNNNNNNNNQPVVPMLYTRSRDPFSQSVWSYFDSNVVDPRGFFQRQMIVRRLTDSLQRDFPQCSLRVFGSQAYAAVTTSDLDLDIVSMEGVATPQPRELLQRFAEKLVLSNCYRDVVLLQHAKVPVIKATDIETGLDIDICNVNKHRDPTCYLLRDYMHFDARVLPFVLGIKYWAKKRHIGQVFHGYLSSFGWVLLCIQYLQTIGILPNFQSHLESFARRMPQFPAPMLNLLTIVPGHSQFHQRLPHHPFHVQLQPAVQPPPALPNNNNNNGQLVSQSMSASSSSSSSSSSSASSSPIPWDLEFSVEAVTPPGSSASSSSFSYVDEFPELSASSSSSSSSSSCGAVNMEPTTIASNHNNNIHPSPSPPPPRLISLDCKRVSLPASFPHQQQQYHHHQQQQQQMMLTPCRIEEQGPTLKDLFIGFFSFLSDGKVNFNESVVSIRRGRPRPRVEDTHFVNSNAPLIIVDPFDATNNVASHIAFHVFGIIHKECLRGVEILTDNHETAGRRSRRTVDNSAFQELTRASGMEEQHESLMSTKMNTQPTPVRQQKQVLQIFSPPSAREEEEEETTTTPGHVLDKENVQPQLQQQQQQQQPKKKHSRRKRMKRTHRAGQDANNNNLFFHNNNNNNNNACDVFQKKKP